jgi:hypothetical protein
VNETKVENTLVLLPDKYQSPALFGGAFFMGAGRLSPESNKIPYFCPL